MITKEYRYLTKYKAHYTPNYLSVWINPKSSTRSSMFIGDNIAVYSNLRFKYISRICEWIVVYCCIDGTKLYIHSYTGYINGKVQDPPRVNGLYVR